VTRDLSWTGADPDGDALHYRVWLGIVDPPLPAAANLNQPRLELDSLQYGATYYWRVEASDGYHATLGPLWRFTTVPNRAPSVLRLSVPGDTRAGKLTTAEAVAMDPEGHALYYRLGVRGYDRLAGASCVESGFARGPYLGERGNL